MTALGRCSECYRPAHDRPDSLCSGHEHTGMQAPATWEAKWRA